MTYTYKICFISQAVTILTACDGLINWDVIDGNGFAHFKTPDGRISVNMRNVTTIEEIPNEKKQNVWKKK